MPQTDAAASAAAEPLPPALLAARLVAAPDARVIVIAADHGRAERIAAAARAFAPGRAVVLYPATDALPGETVGASPANIGERVAALHRLQAVPADAPAILIAPVAATIDRVAGPGAFGLVPPQVSLGEEIDAEAFAATAEAAGYHPDERVDEPGEYAVRGGVIDIFPVDAGSAVRIAVEDGHVAAIDRYDPLTQRSTEPLETIAIGRAAEPEGARDHALTDHLPGAAILCDPGVERRRARLLALARDARRAADTLVDAAQWEAIVAASPPPEMAEAAPPPPRFVERRDPAAAFARYARKVLEGGALVIAGTDRDLRFVRPRVARRLKLDVASADDWAAAAALPAGTVATLAAPVDRGFVEGGVTVVATADLLGGRAGRDDAPTSMAEALAGGETAIGDLVVHERHGIGRVRGLEPLPDGGEAIALDYARDARRLVPLADADALWRYGADGEAVALDALDGTSWEKRRSEIDAAIAESARGLAALAQERDARTCDPIEPDPAAYERFAASFPFVETADQARAITAVRDDLASGRPMDRLVVGDVGYGKTEVALRAAAMVALAGRQVALAAPTTVLARQHLDTFRRRFDGTGIEVAALSRLTGAAEARRVRAGLADGSIRIVVGTGAVAGKGVAYADLALVILDEEQRFGVADKRRLQALGAGHSLMLSATPIPRTLQGALVGLQAVSVIATPPARRQPIRTAVGVLDDRTIRAALMRERTRAGQSFVVVPRIADIAPLEERLRAVVPELRLAVAHGKLPPAELDETMVAFAAGEGDVLLATNIIEAGLDVPRANTMIVHHADRFGLAQLHQLRGRVGRGGRRGQILLSTEPGAKIADRTMQRLRTLQAFDRLGAGFAISARDLDMRGAGDLLGEEQAGHMKLIGIDLYQHLLGRALRHARGEPSPPPPPVLTLGATGHLPADWIREEGVRLALYMRLVRIETPAGIDQFEEELEDRFGALPPAALRLLDWVRVRLLASSAGVAAISAGPAAIALTPADGHADWSAAGLAAKDGRWIDASAIADEDERLARVRELLEALHE